MWQVSEQTISAPRFGFPLWPVLFFPGRVLRLVWPLLVLGYALEIDQAFADRLILRNLEVISGPRVVDFDEDGVRLDDGRRISWERIERAQVAPDQQAAFDQMLDEIGTHLYRLHQRLSVGDYRGLLNHAQALSPRYVGRDSQSAYVVFQSLMWARLAVGQREAAVEPYVRALDVLQRRQREPIELPGRRRLSYDPQTGLTSDLLPIWFDEQACQAALPAVLRAIGQMAEPRPEGLRIYYGTLALTAGQWEEARRVLAGVRSEHPQLVELLTITVAQGEVLAETSGEALQRLGKMLDRMTPENRPLALYWLGRSSLQNTDLQQRQHGMLQLLELPALYGQDSPDLAAAGLYYTMQALAQDDNVDGRMAVRRELLHRYKQSYHAQLVRQQPIIQTGP